MKANRLDFSIKEVDLFEVFSTILFELTIFVEIRQLTSI